MRFLKSVEMMTVKQTKRLFSTTATTATKPKHYKLVVVGAGSGGCSIAAKFARKMHPNSIAVIEPANMHYYQPMWTLVGGGMKSLSDSGKLMESVLPKDITWIKQKVTRFEPHRNQLSISNSNTAIQYDYLVVALGIQLKYEQIDGLPAAFNTPGVCSNYSPLYVDKTFQSIKNFKKGKAIFSHPDTPIKCGGAPQKIMYITDSYFRAHGKRQDANIIFNTSLGVLFAVKKYADSLWNVVKKKDINVNLKRNLIEVIPSEKKAIFEDLENPGQTVTTDYEMLHVTPPMGPQAVMMENANDLVDTGGYVNLNKTTLQHIKYPNVFGIGDCTNLPTSKTAAAVAGQCGVLFKNLTDVMNGQEPKASYDGYTSCPLITSYSTCILAEFDYNIQPLETFPIDQSQESRIAFQMKKEIMPSIYWNLMLNGYWNGPALVRKLAHLGMK